MRRLNLLLFLIFAATASGCQSNPHRDPINPNTTDAIPAVDEPGRPVAYLNGRPLTQAQLFIFLAEMDGGLALSEVLLDRQITLRLQREGLLITASDIDYEKQVVLDALSEDEDQAVRLLHAMRERRGLGEQRYASLLRRNAGLRKLVHGDIEIGEHAIQQAYELRYGTRYTVRLILCDTAQQAQQVRRLALQGESFIHLAVQYSTDSSAQAGGLLPPINPADASYPVVLRETLPQLSTDTDAQRISPVLTLGQSYAVIRLEEIALARGPGLEAVHDPLEQQVRLRLERLRMQQLAQTLIDSADIIILDPTLQRSWQQQRDRFDQAGTP